MYKHFPNLKQIRQIFWNIFLSTPKQFKLGFLCNGDVACQCKRGVDVHQSLNYRTFT